MKFNYTEKQYVQLAKEKLCQILKEIDDARFVPIDRGHAINIQYIDQIDDCIIYMETKEEFKVSRVQLKNVKKHIARYWRDFA